MFFSYPGRPGPQTPVGICLKDGSMLWTVETVNQIVTRFANQPSNRMIAVTLAAGDDGTEYGPTRVISAGQIAWVA